jgi:5-methyltetrahydropteroyltriglutamate--homocysteine methyltransferase
MESLFTTTQDLMLPTTVTGSWPRPAWFTGRLDGKPLSTALKEVAFREQFTDALSTLLSDQERAGLDILTHGDYFHDEDLGGHSWHQYPLQRWNGLHGDFKVDSEQMKAMSHFAPGTILNEVFGGWRWPRVVGDITPSEETPLEYAKIWRLAQSRTSKPVRFGTVCAQGLPHFLSVEDGLRYDTDDRRELIWDMATAMNKELREVVAAGCKVVQIEEPLIHFIACFEPERTDFIDFLVDAFNHEVEGLDGAEVWVHTCWGNPNMQRAHEHQSYANAVEVYLERLNADVWTVEMRDENGRELELFRPYRDSIKKKVAIGAVSHRSLQVETAEEVADLTRRAIECIPAENLILSSDCGFGRGGCNRLIAYYKSVALGLGANIVRRELGAEERYIPGADPDMQIDKN